MSFKKNKYSILKNAINDHLRPHPISILNVEEVDHSFHARFNAFRTSISEKNDFRRLKTSAFSPAGVFLSTVSRITLPLLIAGKLYCVAQRAAFSSRL